MNRLPFKLIVLSMALMLLFLGCEEESGVVQPKPIFDIISYNVPELVSSSAAESFIVFAEVNHPDGNAGIGSVSLKIISPADSLLREVELKDDGFTVPADSSGDAIAFDLIYSRLFNPQYFSNQDGVYRFELTVTAANESQVATTDKLVEIVQNAAPSIESFVFPDSIFSGAANLSASFVVSDPDGIDDVEWVEIQGTLSGETTVTLFDTLVNPDNGLSNFTMVLDSSYAAGFKGEYQLTFFAEDRFGVKSAGVVKNVKMINTVPVVRDQSVPDTVTIPSAGLLPIEITVRAKDGQSAADLEMVYFDSYLPNGNASSGNPFVMYDNGLAFDPNNSQAVGDTLAGDGIYTLTIFLGSTVPSGGYEFRFFAVDKVGQIGIGPIDTLNAVQ